MATIKDIAQKAGVSITTVSRVLNNIEPVNENTRNTILKVIEETNYTPSIIAQGMRTKKSKTLGVLIPDYMNPFYYVIFKHINDVAREENYHVIAASAGDDTDDGFECINDMVNRNIDGIVACSYKGDKETIEYLLNLSRKLPVVFMDNLEINRSVNAVYTDGYTGIKEITRHLIGLGHEKIAFIKSIDVYKVANDRYQAYKDMLNESGIAFEQELVYEGDYRIKSGYNAAEYFMSGCKITPTAIISSNDLMAVGAMNYLLSHNYRVPQNIAVAGFDDIYLSKLMVPSITTYSQPIETIAREAVKLIINKINHPHTKNKQIVLNGNLVVRRSTDVTKQEVEMIL